MTAENVISIDLRSDTVTKPSAEMRAAMASAEVGDDVFRDDPTILALETRMARMSGKEAALFVPSGTMGNLICVLAHCSERGSEVLLGDRAHIHLYEQGGVSQLGGVHPRTVKNNDDGTFCLKELELKIRGDDPHYPVTRLVAFENSQNKCGGRSISVQWIKQLRELCNKYGLALHCDGARIFNSCISQGISLETYLEDCDSASICFSKGLGCPVGSVIVGTNELIRKAIRLRKVLGGGMRQSGILAGAAIYALDNMIDRLADDHKHARQLAQAINDSGKDRFKVDLSGVDTNIVIMWVDPDTTTPDQVVKALEEGEVNVRTIQFAADLVRFVFHAMISTADAEMATKKTVQVIQQFINQ